MTELQHFLVGSTILIILWHVVVKDFFITPNNKKDLDNEINSWFH